MDAQAVSRDGGRCFHGLWVSASPAVARRAAPRRRRALGRSSGAAAADSTAPSQGFPWVARADARVLVLGSMPGQASLAAAAYYAHPRNVFWEIMGVLFDAGRELDYAVRLDRLTGAGVALWDVAHRCRRPGSLDAAIVRDSVEPNDFAALFRACPQLHTVGFNGGTARELYRRRVLPLDPAVGRPLVYHLLPSTSPAHAALDFSAKLARWRVLAAAATTARR
jgi:hypoxanthine-DNA glycosylase